jgi:hypothetical protein
VSDRGGLRSGSPPWGPPSTPPSAPSALTATINGRSKRYTSTAGIQPSTVTNCKLLSDNVCTPARMCTCLRACYNQINQISALADCQRRDSFTSVGVDLQCASAPCRGANSTFDNQDEMGVWYYGGERAGRRSVRGRGHLGPVRRLFGVPAVGPGVGPRRRQFHPLRRAAGGPLTSRPCIVAGGRHASFVNMRNGNVMVLSIDFPHRRRAVPFGSSNGGVVGTGSGPSRSRKRSGPAATPKSSTSGGKVAAIRMHPVAPSSFSIRWPVAMTVTDWGRLARRGGALPQSVEAAPTAELIRVQSSRASRAAWHAHLPLRPRRDADPGCGAGSERGGDDPVRT